MSHLLNIIFLIFLAAAEVSSQSSIGKVKIDNLLQDEFFNSTSVAVDAYNLTKGEIIYRKNESMLLHPASNMKILTSASALLFLGTGYQFQTRFYYKGRIINRILYGDLIAEGGFDPDFTSSDLDSVCSFIHSYGIDEVKGKIIGDVSAKDSLFWRKGWMWDDDPSTDAPYLSALNINDNAVEVFVIGKTSGSRPEVILDPSTSYIDVINHCTTIPAQTEDSLIIDRDWLKRKNTILIKGTVNQTIPPDSFSARKSLNIFEPEKYFLSLFRETLLRSGISVEGESVLEEKPDSAFHLFTLSRPIDSVIVRMNKESNNLSAEMLLYVMALQDSGEAASAENGLNFIDSLILLTGLNPSDYEFADGSGVSRYNLVSAELLLNLLKFIYFRPEVYKIIYDSLPIAGRDGTLKFRMIGTAAEDNLRGKTGTLKGVSALSGYLNSAAGDLIAFSILVQNYKGPASAAQYYIDEICRILTE